MPRHLRFFLLPFPSFQELDFTSPFSPTFHLGCMCHCLHLCQNIDIDEHGENKTICMITALVNNGAEYVACLQNYVLRFVLVLLPLDP